jgi:hypothetical protein
MIDVLKHPELLLENTEEENFILKEKLYFSGNKYNSLEKTKRFLKKHFEMTL